MKKGRIGKIRKKITILLIAFIATIGMSCMAMADTVSENAENGEVAGTAEKVPGTEDMYYYTGAPVCPDVEFKLYYNGRWQSFKEIPGTTYSLSYKDNIEPSVYSERFNQWTKTARVITTISGNYTGTLIFPYYITGYYKNGYDLGDVWMEPFTLYYNPLEDTEQGYDYMQDVRDRLVIHGPDGRKLIEGVDFDFCGSEGRESGGRIYNLTENEKGKEEVNKEELFKKKYYVYIKAHEGTKWNPRSTYACLGYITWGKKNYGSNVFIDGLESVSWNCTDPLMQYLTANAREINIDDDELKGLTENGITIKDVSGNVIDSSWYLGYLSTYDGCVGILEEDQGTTLKIVIRSRNSYKSFGKELLINCAHNMDEGTVLAPTCLESGRTKYKCRDCDYYVYRDIVPSYGGHVEEIVPEKPATCTEFGWSSYTRCSRCGDVIHRGTKIPELGHEYVNETVSATCIQPGYTVDRCIRCGSRINKKNDPNQPAGHDWGEWETIKEPDCKNGGTRQHVCKRDSSHIETEYIGPLGHDYETITTPPTCTDAGSVDLVCRRCGQRGTLNTIHRLGHSWVNYEDLEPTWTEEGHTGGSYCSVCGRVRIHWTVIPPLRDTQGSSTSFSSSSSSSYTYEGSGSGDDEGDNKENENNENNKNNETKDSGKASSSSSGKDLDNDDLEDHDSSSNKSNNTEDKIGSSSSADIGTEVPDRKTTSDSSSVASSFSSSSSISSSSSSSSKDPTTSSSNRTGDPEKKDEQDDKGNSGNSKQENDTSSSSSKMEIPGESDSSVKDKTSSSMIPSDAGNTGDKDKDNNENTENNKENEENENENEKTDGETADTVTALDAGTILRTVHIDEDRYDKEDTAKAEQVVMDAYAKVRELEINVPYAGKKTMIAGFTFAGAAPGQKIPGTNIAVAKVTYKGNKGAGKAHATLILKAGRSATKAEKAAIRALNKQFKAMPLEFSIKPFDISVCEVSGTAIYTAKKNTWKFKLTADNMALKFSKDAAKSDFVVDNAYDGSSSVRITGRGNFTGEKEVKVIVK